MNKTALRQAFLEELRAELSRQQAAVALARDEASHEESRARSKYDTRSQEAAYLAEGQARLVADVEAAIAAFAALPLPDFLPSDPIAIGALVGIQVDGRVHTYFIGPRAGGLEVAWDGTNLLVVTPNSPLGRTLLGQRAGSTLAIPGRRSATSGRIVSVR